MRVDAKADVQATVTFDEVSVYKNSLPNGVVVIMFDDGDATVYMKAKPLMDRKGWAGVLNVMTNTGAWDYWEALYDSG